jgi:hypothetical protein
MKMKISQILTAFACDTAQVMFNEKTAKEYLRKNDIVDADIQRISEVEMKRKIMEVQINSLFIHFFTKGMERVLHGVKDKPAATYEESYESVKPQIKELL